MPIITEWVHNLHGYNRNIKLFFVFNLLWNTGLGVFGVIYNLYIKALGYEQSAVGNVVAMTALASAISIVPGGILSDKLGPKRVSQFGLALAALALGLRTLMTGETGLSVAAFISGLFLAMLSATGIPFLTENSRQEQRVHLFSFNMSLNMLANMIGNIGGGSLTDILQVHGFSDVMSLRITLLVGVVICALGIIPVSMYRKSKEAEERQLKGAEPKQSVQSIFKQKRKSFTIIGWFTLLAFMSSSAGGLIVPYLNVYFLDRFHSSNTSIGIIVSLGQAATAVAYLIGPALARRLGEVKAVVVLQLSSIPFMLLTASTTNFFLASSGYLFRQALMNAANPFYTSIKMAKVDRSLRGLTNSTGEAAFNMGWFLVAPVNTYFVHNYGSYWGYADAFMITATVYCTVSILFYVLFRDKTRKLKIGG